MGQAAQCTGVCSGANTRQPAIDRKTLPSLLLSGLRKIIRQVCLCCAKDFQNRLSIIRRQVSEFFGLINAGQNVEQSLPDVIARFGWKSVEGFGIDQIAARIFEESRAEIQIAQRSSLGDHVVRLLQIVP